MKRLLVLICAAAAACGGGSSSANSDGTVNGTLSGPNNEAITISSVVEGDSITYSGTACSGSAAESAIGVVLSDRGGACAGFENGAAVSSSTTLFISVSGVSSNGGAAPAIGAAGFTVGNATPDGNGNIFAAAAFVSLFDANCHSVSDPATSGSITVSSISGGVVTGTFDLIFGSTGELTGTFNAPACSLTASQFCSLSSLNTCSG